jgi:hypothetical protein
MIMKPPFPLFYLDDGEPLFPVFETGGKNLTHTAQRAIRSLHFAKNFFSAYSNKFKITRTVFKKANHCWLFAINSDSVFRGAAAIVFIIAFAAGTLLQVPGEACGSFLSILRRRNTMSVSLMAFLSCSGISSHLALTPVCLSFSDSR